MDRIKNIFSNDDTERERLSNSSLFSYNTKSSIEEDYSNMTSKRSISFKTYYIIVVTIAVILLGMYSMKGCSTYRSLYYKQFDTMRLHSELEYYKDEYGKQVAINKTLIVENEQQLEQLVYKAKDLETHKQFILDSKKKINKLEGIIAVLSGSDINVTTVTEVDTVYIDSTKKELVFKGEYKDNYVDIKSVSNKDSTNYNIKVKDDIAIVFGEDKKLFTSSNKILLQNNNPYSVTKQLTFINSKPKTKPFVKYGIGFIAGVITMLILN